EDEVAASASTDEPAEVVYANGDGSHRGAHRARNPEVDETVAERPSVPADDGRAELFATALDLRVEAAVSMTRDQLREAIALVQGSGNGAQAEPAQAEIQAAVEAGSLSAVSAVLQSMRSALDALDALVAEEMAHRAGEEAPAHEQAPPAELEARTDDPPVLADQDEVRAGILTMTRDIIRFARGGSSGQ
ncbi:MAG: hypothetical protein ACTHNU_17340, partial [Gaiellales bacterium]